MSKAPLTVGEAPKETQFKAREKRNLCQHHQLFLGDRLRL